ncbi:Nif3-like dinuclear metal center hexameric protein [Elusimicrobiota bacterium]
MKPKDIIKHFISRADWVDPVHAADRVIVGDSEKDFEHCLVMWSATMSALRAAVEKGSKLIISHEAVFYHGCDEHLDNSPARDIKKRFIEENGLTIIRIHDSWDGWPDIGILWTWARFLGFNGKPVKSSGRFEHRFDIRPVAFGEFAKRVAAKTAVLGEPAVQVMGDPNQQVSKIGIGTGCLCDVLKYIDMDCDCCIVCDDGSRYDESIKYADELNMPVIRVNHATSEEPGIVTLARYINDNLPGLKAEHLAQGCSFRLLSSQRGNLPAHFY